MENYYSVTRENRDLLRLKSQNKKTVKICAGSYYCNGMLIQRNEEVPSGYYDAWRGKGKSFSSFSDAKKYCLSL